MVRRSLSTRSGFGVALRQQQGEMEFAADAEELRASDRFAMNNAYLSRLSRYSDEDGYTLSAPQRYSVKDWSMNLVNLPASTVLERVKGHLVFNTLWSIVVVLGYGAWVRYEAAHGSPFVDVARSRAAKEGRTEGRKERARKSRSAPSSTV